MSALLRTQNFNNHFLQNSCKFTILNLHFLQLKKTKQDLVLTKFSYNEILTSIFLQQNYHAVTKTHKSYLQTKAKFQPHLTRQENNSFRQIPKKKFQPYLADQNKQQVFSANMKNNNAKTNANYAFFSFSQTSSPILYLRFIASVITSLSDTNWPNATNRLCALPGAIRS